MGQMSHDNQDHIDALNVALNVKGEREAALRHSLEKRADMIEDAFERIRKVRKHEEKEKDRLLALQLEQQEREKSARVQCVKEFPRHPRLSKRRKNSFSRLAPNGWSKRLKSKRNLARKPSLHKKNFGEKPRPYHRV